MSYKTTNSQKTDSIINSHKLKKSKSWINLLPNISYNFNPITAQNNFSIGINLNSYASYYQQKQRNKIELLKIKTQLNDKLEKNIENLENNYLELTSKLNHLKQEINIFKLDFELLNIFKKQYENNKINLQNWLKEKINYNKKYSLILNKINELTLKFNKFQTKIKSPDKMPELNILNTLKSHLKELN